MRRQVVAGVVAAAVLTVLPAFAQTDTQYGAWTHAVDQDDFSGEVTSRAFASGDEVMLFVNCYLGTELHLSVHLFDGIFRDGNIAMRWNEDAIERYSFTDNNQSLSAAEWVGADDFHPALEDIIAKLMAHSELRLRVGRWPDTQVTDRISLNGSTRAIGALACR